jgi:hypothetical protein
MESKTERELINILFEKVRELEKEIAILKTKQYVSNGSIIPAPIYEHSYKDWLNQMTVTEEYIKYILESVKIDFVDGFKNYIEKNIAKTEIPICFYKKKLYVLEKEKDVNKWKIFDKENTYSSFITIVYMKMIKFLHNNRQEFYEENIIWEKIRLMNTMKSNLMKPSNRDSIIKWMKEIAIQTNES